MLEERLKEIAAAIHMQIRSWLVLESADMFRHVAAENHRGLPFVRRHGIRGDVLGRGIDARPSVRMMRPIECPTFIQRVCALLIGHPGFSHGEYQLGVPDETRLTSGDVFPHSSK